DVHGCGAVASFEKPAIVRIKFQLVKSIKELRRNQPRVPEGDQHKHNVMSRPIDPEAVFLASRNAGVKGHDGRAPGSYVIAFVVSIGSSRLSQPHEKFLLEPSRKFRFDKAWRNDSRSCGCRRR